MRRVGHHQSARGRVPPDARPRSRGTRVPRLRSLCLLLLLSAHAVAASSLSGAASEPVSARDPFEAVWELDLQEVGGGTFEGDEGWSTLTLSPDGRVLVAGTHGGGLLFVDAADEDAGHLLRAFDTVGHGAVEAISTTHDGSRAAVRWSSGYLAVLAHGTSEPLLELNAAPGADPGPQPAIAIRAIAPEQPGEDGEWVFTLGNNVSAYRYAPGADGGAGRFVWMGAHDSQVGPYTYVSSTSLNFGAIGANGRVELYTFRTSRDPANDPGVRLVGGADLLSEPGAALSALTISDDRSHVAVGLTNGTVERYRLNPLSRDRFLVPEYRGHLGAGVDGVRLSPEGDRIVAWSVHRGEDDVVVHEPDRDEGSAVEAPMNFLWAAGDNLQTDPERAAATNAAAVLRHHPELRHVDPSRDLFRVLLRDDASTVVTNLPEETRAGSSQRGAGAEPAMLDADGSHAFLVSDTTLGRYVVAEAVLPPPEQRPAVAGDEDIGADAASTDRGALSLIGLDGGTGTFWAGLTALAALLALLVVVGAVLVHRGRRTDEGQARHEDPEALSEVGVGAWSRLAGSGTPVTDASYRGTGLLPTDVAAEGAAVTEHPSRLVLDAIHHAEGGTRFEDLRLEVRGPGVVRLRMDRPAAYVLTKLLTGARPAAGQVAVGGVDAMETPLLFRRRVQVGPPPLPHDHETPEDAMRRMAAHWQLPRRIRDSRIAKDLAWLPAPGRARPVSDLTAFDRWKLRIALGLVHRPDVLVLGPEDRADPTAPLPSAAERKVLRGIARHYDVVVLLLDDRPLPPDAPRDWLRRDLMLRHGRIVDAGQA